MTEEVPTHKICTKCSGDKPLEEFHKAKSGKYGRTAECKKCLKIRNAQSHQDHKEARLKTNKKYREDHKEEIKIQKKEYQEDHKEEKKEYDKIYRENHKEEAREYQKEYCEDNKEELAVKNKQWREDNKEEINIKKKEYRKTDRFKNANRKRQERYRKSPKGRELHRKVAVNRRKGLGWVALNEIFDDSNGHHIDTEHVIYIPKDLHNLNIHHLRGVKAGLGMDNMNTLAFEYLFDNTDDLVVSEEFALELKDKLLPGQAS